MDILIIEIMGMAFIFVLAGREYKVDIVLSKNGVKCAVFKFSDVQILFVSFLVHFWWVDK